MHKKGALAFAVIAVGLVFAYYYSSTSDFGVTVEEDGRTCRRYPLVNSSDRGLPYGYCNVVPGERADYYCECKRPFRWEPVDHAVHLTAGERSSSCTLDRCCFGSTTAGWKDTLKCNHAPTRKFRLVSGRPLFSASHLIDHLANGTRLTILGDSVGYQSYVGLLCELTRHGVRYVADEYQITRRSKRHWKVGWAYLQKVLVFNSRNDTITVQLIEEYTPALSGVSYKEACAVSDILVVNSGVHYNSRSQQRHQLYPALFPALQDHCVSRGVQVVFRGSTAQHFFRPGGDFLQNTSKKGGSDMLTQDVMQWMHAELNQTDYGFDAGCVAQHWMLGFEHEYNWRNRQTVAEFSRRGLPLRYPPWGASDDACQSEPFVGFIPMGEITAELWRHHETECTHYCHSPLLWEPIWDALYLFVAQMRCLPLTPPPRASLVDPHLPSAVRELPTHYFIRDRRLSQVYKDYK